MQKHVALIVNPGSGADSTVPGDLAAVLRQEGIEADIPQPMPNEDIEAARRLVASGRETIIAAGGDGTVNAVARALVDQPAVLGILPVGTLNHLAKDLGIPLDLSAAARVIAEGGTVDMDVGDVNGEVFLNNSSIGLYPLMVRDRERQQLHLNRPKWRAAIVAAFAALRIYPMLHVEIHIHGKRINRRTPFVFIGNNEYVIEGREVGKRKSLDEGTLCLLVTHRTRRLGILWLAVRALSGRLRSAKDFDSLSATEIAVHLRRSNISVALDGEVKRMQTPLCYRIRPGALRVIVSAEWSKRKEANKNAEAPTPL